MLPFWIKLFSMETVSGKLAYFRSKGYLKFIAANFMIFLNFIVVHSQMYFLTKFLCLFRISELWSIFQLLLQFTFRPLSRELPFSKFVCYTQKRILWNVCQSIYHLILYYQSVKVLTKFIYSIQILWNRNFSVKSSLV